MDACVLGLVASCSVAPPITSGPLRVIPLRGPAASAPLPVPAGRLQPPEDLRLSERDDDARVEEIQAYNPTSRDVLLLEGELLAGGYQDRMVAASALVRRRSAGVLPTACSEEGRFEGDDPLLRPSGRLASPRYRRRLRLGLHGGVGSAGASLRQQALWDDIEADRRALDLPGAGVSLLSLVEAVRGPCRDLAAGPDRSREPVSGWMFFLGGAFMAGDLFADPEAAAAYGAALHEAAAYDALVDGMRKGLRTATGDSGGAGIPSGRWEEMGAELEQALVMRQETATGAARLRFESPALTGSVLLDGNRPLHLSFFPAVYPEDLAPLP